MGYLNTFLDGLVIGIVIAAIVLALWGSYTLIDKSFLPTLRVKGIVVGKSHAADGWRLYIDTFEGQRQMTTSLGVYDAARKGQPVVVDFTRRRLTRRMQVVSLS